MTAVSRLRGILLPMLWLSTAAGVFLAFGWPFLVSTDPADEGFRLVATATVTTFLLALAGLLGLRAARPEG